jgi:hypothetical protein
LRPGRELLAEGRAVARDWRVGRTPFLKAAAVACEAEYKRAMAARGRIMHHAHIGFRSVVRTVDAIMEVHETCARRGVTVDRFGITLDWSMGYPAADRAGRGRGTGIVLNGPEDFARITCAAPAAAHFGDFMLGLPGALDNTKHALAAGATAIGNLGQYFTFRLPDWDDDIATTEATVTALGLIAAQDVGALRAGARADPLRAVELRPEPAAGGAGGRDAAQPQQRHHLRRRHRQNHQPGFRAALGFPRPLRRRRP